MNHKAEYFLESLYFPTGDGECAVVDAVDDSLFVSNIEQALSDVVDDMMFNTRDAELCSAQLRMVELCNQYNLSRFADYAQYCTQKSGPDSAEYELFANFCRLCDRYRPGSPVIPATTPLEVYRYLNEMFNTADKFNELDDLIGFAESPVPYISVQSRMSRNDRSWELHIAIMYGNETLDTIVTVTAEPKMSADEAALLFNHTLLDSPYHMLAIKWGDWGRRDGLQGEVYIRQSQTAGLQVHTPRS